MIFLFLLFCTIASSLGQIHPECVDYVNYRSLDGYCNNLYLPDAGRAGTILKRLGEPRKVPVNLPNEREVSQLLFADIPKNKDPFKLNLKERAKGTKVEKKRNLNMLSVIFGQFLSHDTDLTPLRDDVQPIFGISIPNCLPNTSSLFDELCIYSNPFDPNRLPFNQTSIFARQSEGIVDCDGIFQPFNNKLRSFVDGKLLEGPGGLPNNSILKLPNECNQNGQFVGHASGDLRVDENPLITALHVLFVKNHNYIADKLIRDGWVGDEKIFQKARILNNAEWQHVTVDEWLFEVFGPENVPNFIQEEFTYDATNPADVFVEFSTVLFRQHSNVNLPLLMLDKQCNILYGKIQNFTNQPPRLQENANCIPDIFDQYGAAAVIRGGLAQHSQASDLLVTDGLRNIRTGGPGNVDVRSADVFRGRLFSIPDYNTLRQLVGLPDLYTLPGCSREEDGNKDTIGCFHLITSNETLAELLRDVYKRVDRIDPTVGVDAEDIFPGSSQGETITRGVLEQFRLLRASDRFYYQNPFIDITEEELAFIESVTMSELIRRAFPELEHELPLRAFRTNVPEPCYGLLPQGERDDEDQIRFGCCLDDFTKAERRFYEYINLIEDFFNADTNESRLDIGAKIEPYLAENFHFIARACNGSINEESFGAEEFLEDEFIERCCTFQVNETFFFYSPATIVPPSGCLLDDAKIITLHVKMRVRTRIRFNGQCRQLQEDYYPSFIQDEETGEWVLLRLDFTSCTIGRDVCTIN